MKAATLFCVRQSFNMYDGPRNMLHTIGKNAFYFVGLKLKVASLTVALNCSLTGKTCLPIDSKSTNLFPHWLGVGDGGAKESVPLQSAIEPCPVIVSVAGVGKTPGDEGAKLLVRRVARLALRTRAHATQGTIRITSVPLVVMGVLPVVKAST